MSSGKIPKRKRSQYSRKGCKQCKKAHVKCDEARPQCSTCGKRGIKCIYEVRFVFQRTEHISELSTSDIVPQMAQPSSNFESELEPSDAQIFQGDLDGSSNVENKQAKCEASPTLYVGKAESTLDLDSMIYISPTELNLLNLLNFDGPSIHPLPSRTEPRTDLFAMCWRKSNCMDVCQILKRHDPIWLSFEKNMCPDVSGISLEDPGLLDFIWTLTKNTQCAGNFILFPDEHFEQVLQLMLGMNKEYAVIQDAVLYDCALFMKDIYNKRQFRQYSQAWDRYVRIPSLKPCLDTLRERINKTTEFGEYVALAFVVIVLFAAKSCYRSNTWRTHLKGSHQILKRAEELLPKSPYTESQITSVLLYEILQDWFCHAEILASISSDSGGSISRSSELQAMLERAPYSDCTIFRGKFDLFRGYSTNLYPIFTKICLRLLDLKSQGINLSGTNLLKFKMTNTDAIVQKELDEFGTQTLRELNSISVGEEDMKNTIGEIHDLRLQLSIRNSNKMYFLALKLYLKVFFITSSEGVEDLEYLVDQLLETAYCIPYCETAGIACHWTIYMGGLVSLVTERKNEYHHFVEILSRIAANGFFSAINSIERLTFISEIMERKDYSLFVNPSLDFIVY